MTTTTVRIIASECPDDSAWQSAEFVCKAQAYNKGPISVAVSREAPAAAHYTAAAAATTADSVTGKFASIHTSNLSKELKSVVDAFISAFEPEKEDVKKSVQSSYDSLLTTASHNSMAESLDASDLLKTAAPPAAPPAAASVAAAAVKDVPPKSSKPPKMQLEEVEVSLSVNAQGSAGFLCFASASAGTEGHIRLVFRRGGC